MAAISTTIDIDRPAEAVFAYATDPARFHEWRQGVVNGATDTQGEPRVGDRCLTTRRIGFAERPVTAELGHIDARRPGECVASTARSEPPSTSPSSRWARTGRGGRSRSSSRPRVGRLLVPLVVERSARKEMPVNVAVLKERVESST